MRFHRFVAATACALLLPLAAAPAWAQDDPAETIPVAALEDDAVLAHFDAEEVQEGLKSGEDASTLQEEKAVQDYLATLPEDAPLTEAADLEVGTVEMSEGLEMTIVSPADATPEAVDVSADVQSGEVSAGASWSVDESVGTSTGPGMAATWQSWDDVPMYRLILRLYVDHGDWNDYLGRAEFHTSTRKLLNDGDVRTRWQVRRWAQAIPQTWEKGIDTGMRVDKLWISNDPINDKDVRGWVVGGQGGTSPTNNEKVCEEKGSFTVAAGAASFTVPVSNCEDWDVWRGPGDTDGGHYRMAYSQGAWAGAGNREAGYASGYEMKHGVSGHSTFYEFVTLRIGNQAGDRHFKCKSEEKGTEGTDGDSCWWGDDAYQNNPDKWAN